MSEKRFLSYILTEGILLTVLSIFMLLLPKITEISFGLAMCLGLIIYGGYKAIISFLAKNFDKYYLLNIFDSLILIIAGLIMFFMPVTDMIIIISMLGVYFVLQSISTLSFAFQLKKMFQFYKIGYFISGVQLFFGIILLLLFPVLWIGGILVGLNFLLSGLMLINIHLSRQYEN